VIDRSGLNLNYSPCKIKCWSSLSLSVLSVCLSPSLPPSLSLPPPHSLSALQDVGLILGIRAGYQVFGSTVTRGAVHIHTHDPTDVTNRPSGKHKKLWKCIRFKFRCLCSFWSPFFHRLSSGENRAIREPSVVANGPFVGPLLRAAKARHALCVRYWQGLEFQI